MARAYGGMDPSPLLPLGVLLAVVVMFFTPMLFQVRSAFMDTTHQILALLWLIPVLLVSAVFLTSSDWFGTSSSYQRRPVYHSYPQYGGESPSWGLLGLMLLMLVLLPWRY